MKKIFLALIVLAGITTGLSSCMFRCVHGSGKIVSEDRQVSDFSKISVSGAFKVIMKQDSSMSVKITGDDNLMKYIKTESDGDKLHIFTKRNFCNSGEITINIGVRNLEELRASGAVDVDAQGKFHAQNMHFNLSGASRISMELTATEVSTSASGASELNIKGQATSNNIDLSGASKVYAFDFVVNSSDIQSSGAGYAEVNILSSLNVNSSGGSEVKYKGNPSTVHNDSSGGSSVNKVN
jgi:hypothetical protein